MLASAKQGWVASGISLTPQQSTANFPSGGQHGLSRLFSDSSRVSGVGHLPAPWGGGDSPFSAPTLLTPLVSLHVVEFGVRVGLTEMQGPISLSPGPAWSASPLGGEVTRRRPSPSPPPPCALSACSGSGWNGRTGGGQQPSSAGAKDAPQVPRPGSLGHAAPAGTQLCTMPCSLVTCSRSKPCSKMKTLPT